MLSVTPEYLASQGFSPTLVDRLWDKFVIVPYDRGCWLWLNSRLRFGYGRIKTGRRGILLAHVVMWIISKGPKPDGLFVLHKCDNPRCVNPDHLFLGTKRDNALDMIAKGRWKPNNAMGADRGNSKLSNRQVVEIRRLLLTEKHRQRKLAKMFGVSQSVISEIKQRKVWKHI